MGNFSRDTFDPSKGYTGVRLQQGVPIVDADWNELQDVIRHELYDHFANQYGIWNDGVLPYSSMLGLYAPSSPSTFYENNFYVYSGAALVGGRLFYCQGGAYNQQRWFDPVVAEEEGVDVIPPLTTPGSARTDAVYLDIWDREVGSDEDPDIINPVIGIETSVRSKREVAVRVNEGNYYHPWPIPTGHRYLMLARLNRTAGNANITSDLIDDQRRILYDRPGTYYISVNPTVTLWGSSTGFRNYTGYAVKLSSQSAYGVVPLTLPHGLKMSFVQIRGQSYSGAEFTIRLNRSGNDTTGHEILDEELNVQGSPSFTRYLYWPSNDNLVDNSQYSYQLYFYSPSTGYGYITGIRVYYSI